MSEVEGRVWQITYDGPKGKKESITMAGPWGWISEAADRIRSNKENANVVLRELPPGARGFNQ